jgi:uncharacterized protein (DUF1330 family)
MPKGYWITRVDVYDAEQFEKYKAANVELFARYEASFLIRGSEQTLVEGTARGRNVVIEFPSYRAALQRSRSIIDDLEPWLRGTLALISQKLAEAIRYALSRWGGPGRFLDDGCVEIDSNVVERAWTVSDVFRPRA